MKHIEKTLLIIGLCAALNAQAGLQPSALYSGPTANSNNVVLAATTTNIAGNTNAVQTLFDFSKTTDATIQISGQTQSTNTVNATNVFVFDGSTDTAIWTSNVFSASVTFVAPNSGTILATNGYITNLVNGVSRFPFVRLNSITNTGTTGVASNIVIKAYSKTGF